jgi:hypothetical protein
MGFWETAFLHPAFLHKFYAELGACTFFTRLIARYINVMSAVYLAQVSCLLYEL